MVALNPFYDVQSFIDQNFKDEYEETCLVGIESDPFYQDYYADQDG